MGGVLPATSRITRTAGPGSFSGPGLGSVTMILVPSGDQIGWNQPYCPGRILRIRPVGSAIATTGPEPVPARRYANVEPSGDQLPSFEAAVSNATWRSGFPSSPTANNCVGPPGQPALNRIVVPSGLHSPIPPSCPTSG